MQYPLTRGFRFLEHFILGMFQFRVISRQACQMDPIVFGEMRQLVEGSDLFAFIGRVGNTM